MLSQVPLPSVSVKDGKIYIGEQVFELPPKLVPPTDVAQTELPYVIELLASFAEAENIANISKETLSRLYPKYQRNFNIENKIPELVESLSKTEYSISGGWNADLRNMQNEDEPQLKYKPMDFFDNGFWMV